MAYATVNFPTKKALKTAVLANDPPVRIQAEMIGHAPTNGAAWLEGPWYPRPHSWYAEVQLADGIVVRVL